MIRKTKNYFLAALVIATLGMVSCGEDEGGSPTQSITVSTNTIDLGEVIAGTVATSEFTVSATQGGTLEVTGDGYELDITSFAIPGISNTITLSFSPASDASAGSSSATITITAGDLSETINVTATVIEPEIPFLASGTTIYSNVFTFDAAIGHGDSLEAPVLDQLATVLEGVTAVHEIVNFELESGEPAGRVGATYQVNFALCDDTIVDDKATSDDNDNDFSCGGAITIQGVQPVTSTSITFKMSGLLPDQPAELVYWLRPNGDNERGINVSFTGAEDVAHLFNNEDGSVENFNRIYTKYTVAGKADENGELIFKALSAVPENNTSRGVSIDNVSIVVP